MKHAIRLCDKGLGKTCKDSLDCKEIKPVNPEGNQSWIFIGRTDVEAEAPILWPPDAKNWHIGKGPGAGKDWRQKKGMTEDDMVGWHHWLNGHEFEQAQLAQCCSRGGHKESDTTEQLNNKRQKKIKTILLLYFLVFLIYWWLRRKKRNTFFFFSLKLTEGKLAPGQKSKCLHFIFFPLSCMNEALNFRKGTKTAPNQVQR